MIKVSVSLLKKYFKTVCWKNVYNFLRTVIDQNADNLKPYVWKDLVMNFCLPRKWLTKNSRLKSADQSKSKSSITKQDSISQKHTNLYIPRSFSTCCLNKANKIPKRYENGKCKWLNCKIIPLMKTYLEPSLWLSRGSMMTPRYKSNTNSYSRKRHFQIREVIWLP